MVETNTELAVVDAVFDNPVPSKLHGRCEKVLPSGVRCALMVIGRRDMLCHMHSKQRSGLKGKKVSTTVYLRQDQVTWLRGVSDAAGIALAELIRHAIDEFRQRAEAQLGPGETIDTEPRF